MLLSGMDWGMVLLNSGLQIFPQAINKNQQNMECKVVDDV
jgi:hypothetical protein